MKRWVLYSLLASILASTLPACRTSASRQLWERSQAAGRELGPREPALLHTVAIVDPDPEIGQYCSGVLIGTRHILTAASCLLDTKRIPYVFLERPYQPNLAYDERGELKRIELAVVPAAYQEARSQQYRDLILAQDEPRKFPKPGKPLSDIAVATLEGEVTAPYQPIRLFSGDMDFRTAKLFLAWYGCGFGTCDESTIEIDKTALQFVRYLPEAAFVHLKQHESRACNAATGGPIYYQDAQGVRLFALRTTDPKLCESDVILDTIVPAYRSWIDQAHRVLARPMIQAEGFRVIDFTYEP